MTEEIIQLSPNWAVPGDEIVVTYGPPGQILLYKQPDWEILTATIIEACKTNKKLHPIRRQIIGHANTVIVDATMCVQLPKFLVDLCTTGNRPLLWIERQHIETDKSFF